MHGNNKISLQAQRGISVTGLIVVLALIGMVAMLAMKVFPYVMEYQSAKGAIVTAKNTQGTAMNKRMTFQRAIDTNDITSVTNKDLIIYKVNSDDHVAFDYEVRVELFKDVALLLHFAATTDPSGVIPPKKAVEGSQ